MQGMRELRGDVAGLVYQAVLRLKSPKSMTDKELGDAMFAATKGSGDKDRYRKLYDEFVDRGRRPRRRPLAVFVKP